MGLDPQAIRQDAFRVRATTIQALESVCHVHQRWLLVQITHSAMTAVHVRQPSFRTKPKAMQPPVSAGASMVITTAQSWCMFASMAAVIRTSISRPSRNITLRSNQQVRTASSVLPISVVKDALCVLTVHRQ